MKVALDVSAVPPRIAGAGRYVVELARRLPRREVVTTLVSRRDDDTRWRQLVPDAAAVTGLVPRGRVARLAYEAWVLGATRSARDVDVWHSPHYTMPHRGAAPTVVTVHDLTFFTNPEWHERAKVAFFRRAIDYSVRHARVVVCVSEYTARVLPEVVSVAVPIVVAPLGVDLERYGVDADPSLDEAALAPYRLSRDAAVVLFVGTAEPRKGLDVLLNAFDVLARDDADVELWLVGQSGWGVAALEDQLGRLAHASRIRRLGFVDDDALPALYRRASVVAYPSRGEGFGLPVLEAMACGAVVVTTRATVMEDVAGGEALLVTAGDELALADALARALALDDDERRARAARARARAELFTWDACVDRHLVAYRRALAGQ